MLAIVRSDTWEWALFFHVLGTLVVIGAMALVATTAFAAVRTDRPEGALTLRRLTFRAIVLLVLPSFVLMRGTAEWVRTEDGFADDVTWINVGYIVTDLGLVVLLALSLLGWHSARTAARGDPRVSRATRVVAVLAPLYLVALLVAMWAMTTKPD